MPSKMAKSKLLYGQGHKDKYLDISRKISSQEMLMYNMKALILIYFEVMTNVKFFYLKG